MKLPKARTENLLEQNLKNETLIYDLTIGKAFNLNETLSVVYKACGQNMTFDELKRTSKFTDDLIHFALDELRANNLIEGDVTNHFAGLSRRDVIKKVGLGSMIALPVIAGLAAPKAITAQSGCVADGQPGSVTAVSNSFLFACEIDGYPDPACCSGFATGTLDDSGNCEDIVCGGGGLRPGPV